MVDTAASLSAQSSAHAVNYINGIVAYLHESGSVVSFPYVMGGGAAVMASMLVRHFNPTDDEMAVMMANLLVTISEFSSDTPTEVLTKMGILLARSGHFDPDTT